MAARDSWAGRPTLLSRKGFAGPLRAAGSFECPRKPCLHSHRAPRSQGAAICSICALSPCHGGRGQGHGRPQVGSALLEPNFSSARKYTAESEVGRTLQVGTRPGRRATPAAPGQEASGRLFTGHGLDLRRGAATDLRTGSKTDAERASRWPSSRGERTRALSHTCTHTGTHSLTGALTHAVTHTCMCTRCSHSRPHAHPLLLTSVQVLTSGSWPRFWRFKPPWLHLSTERFSRPPMTSQSPRLCVP